MFDIKLAQIRKELAEIEIPKKVHKISIPLYPQTKPKQIKPKLPPLETFVKESNRNNCLKWIAKVDLHNDTQLTCDNRLALNNLCPRRDENKFMGRVSNYNRLYEKKYCQMLAFTRDERIFFNINALLPYGAQTEDQQLIYYCKKLNRMRSNLDKYFFLLELSERCERLFYIIIKSNIKKWSPIVYTPTVASAVQAYSSRWISPKGIYITYADKGHIIDCLKQSPERGIRVICVTDGERILGIGDWGANGMLIPVGKCALYTAYAGVKPYHMLPITLDVGTNNVKLLNDPHYIGMKRRRLRGPEYTEFMDEYMEAVKDLFGCACLVQFEDFGRDNALELLKRYEKKYCCFNDDIQGTACVVVACLLNAMKATNMFYSQHKLLFVGAGQAAIGTASLYEQLLISKGLTKEAAKEAIWLFDTKGLVTLCRPRGGLDKYKLMFAHNSQPIDKLLDAIIEVRPTALIGVSATGNSFTPEILEKMAEFNEIPVIFALSNPTEKAECTAHNAYLYTNGKCLYASGSPFGAVKFEGKFYHPSQCNNSFVFPGIIMGIITAGLTYVPNELFLLIANKLASLVSQKEIENGSLLPQLEGIRDVSTQIAATILEFAFRNRLTPIKVEPIDKIIFLRAQMYDMHYQELMPPSFFKNKKDLCRSDDEDDDERQLATMHTVLKKKKRKPEIKHKVLDYQYSNVNMELKNVKIEVKQEKQDKKPAFKPIRLRCN